MEAAAAKAALARSDSPGGSDLSSYGIHDENALMPVGVWKDPREQ